MTNNNAHKAHWIYWFIFAPVLLWAVFSIAVPFFLGKAGTPRYLEFLNKVQHVEMNTAEIVTPGISFFGHDLVVCGWAYRIAENTVREWIPADKQGITVEREQQATDDKINADAERERTTQVKSDVSDGRKILAKAGSYINDAFYPVQRTYLITIFTRALQALALFIVFIPIIVAGLYFGTFVCRERIRDGVLPLAHRYMIYATLCKTILIGISLIIVIPILVPGVLVMIFLYMALVFFGSLARANTVPNL